MRMLASSVAAAAALAGAAVAVPTGAGADAAKGTDAAIEIKSNNRGPKFVVPDSIEQGGTLEIVNGPNALDYGPHTFSIMKKSAIPKGEEERKRCGHFHGICKKIRLAHGLPRHDFIAEVDDVENGSAGWDTGWIGQTEGDSSYLSEEDEVETRSTPAATAKLWFMCSIHPKMQDSIEIVTP